MSADPITTEVIRNAFNAIAEDMSAALGHSAFSPVIYECHERKSIIVTTNLAFSEWVQVLGDEKLTTSLLDRLARRAYILTTKRPSYRTNRRRKEE